MNYIYGQIYRMENSQLKNIDRLAGYVIKLGILAIIAFACWYFSNVLVYIVLAFIISLIGKPLVRLMRKVSIGGKSAPDWLLAVLTILIIFALLALVATRLVPVVTGVFREASVFSNMRLPEGNVLNNINSWIVSVIPRLSPDYDAVGVVMDYMKGAFSDVSISGILGSVASAVGSLAIGLFSVAFISFFFLKDDNLFANIVAALTPDHFEGSVRAAINDSERLLSRYFVGLVLEMLCVALVDFLGLWLIARVSIGYAISIGFLAGILNIIPYVGPLLGEVIGVLLCVVLKYGAGIGLDVNIWIFALIVLIIMLGVQLIDNFILQPLIYSTSIKATPLEIFIVILIAGHIGGIWGMLAAIPAYTVVRVVAGRFYSDKKLVRRLMPEQGKG